MLRILVKCVVLVFAFVVALGVFKVIASVEEPGIMEYEFERNVAADFSDKVVIDGSAQEELIETPPLISVRKVWVKNQTGGYSLKSKYIYRAGAFRTKEGGVILGPGARIETLGQFRLKI